MSYMQVSGVVVIVFCVLCFVGELFERKNYDQFNCYYMN